MRHRFLDGWMGAGVCSLLMLFLVLGTFSLVGLLNPPAAMAQDGGGDALDDVLSDVSEAVAADDDLPEPAAEPVKTEEAEPATEGGPSVLVWMFQSLGIGYAIVFLAMSFTLVSLVVMNILAARRDSVLPVTLIEGFEAHLNEKQYQEAYEMAKEDESFLGRVLSAGLAKLSSGYEPAIEAMQEVGDEENMKLEHRLSYIALIGTISPMVGLLGTVQGMISAFQTIATSGATPKPAELAGGISTALFTTLVGLFIAIPAIAVYNILRNRVARLVLEVGIVSEGLMNRFSNVGGKKNG